MKAKDNTLLYVIIFVLLFVIGVMSFFLMRAYRSRDLKRSAAGEAATVSEQDASLHAGDGPESFGTESVFAGEETGMTEDLTEAAEESVFGEGEEAMTEALTEQAAPETETEPVKNGFKVCLDPGHQGSDIDMSEPEPIGPGAEETKAKATTGTQGNYTGVPEYRLNLDIAIEVRDLLEARGYEVVMTRTIHEAAISNSERAQLAAAEGCDISVRIHANSSEDTSISGALAMCVTPENPYAPQIYEESRRLSETVLGAYCAQTGMNNLGIQETDGMTGLNWSTIPVTILEMGFMSNESDDTRMQEESFREKMVLGIADGIDAYFGLTGETAGEEEAGTEGAGQEEVPEDEGPAGEAASQVFAGREAMGERWSLCVIDLAGDKTYQHGANLKMQSASVIKCFIMGAVYDRICYPASEETAITYPESYEGELRSLLEQMISVSDNAAANRLIEILGKDDFAAGAEIVNQFCVEHGYTGSSVGRRFLEENPSGDNYTCAADCAKILADIYRGELVSPEASEKMLGLLKMQTNLSKIPSGLPEGTQTANKTGEMPEGYGLGCIENDMAIVYGPEGDYAIAVLSNELAGRNDEAVSAIRRVSTIVWNWFGGVTEEAAA